MTLENFDLMSAIAMVSMIVTGASIILKAIKDYTKTELDNKLYKALVKTLEILSIATKDPKVEVVIKE